MVRIGDAMGGVHLIDLLSVKLRTVDSRLVRIPNDVLIKRKQSPSASASPRRPPSALTLAFLLAISPAAHAGPAALFNEVMYHPATNEAALEWIELHNPLACDLDLSLWRLRGGVEFDFPAGTVVPARGYLVIAAAPAALAATGCTNAVGPFSGRLDNGGEEIRLRNNSGRLMDTLAYGDSGDWPVPPDGAGASLCKRREHDGGADAANWTWSLNPGGTPGAANTPAETGALRINEIPSATNAAFWVELINTGNTSLSLSNHTLSVLGSTTGVCTFTSETIPAAGRLLVADARLGARPVAGDKLVLRDGTRVLDAIDAASQPRSRFTDGASTWFTSTWLTPGETNRVALNADVVINELMYHPPLPRDAASPTPPAWIEIYNRGTNTIDLEGWRIDDAVRYTFPPDTRIPSGGFLVVTDDTNAFAAVYPAAPVPLGPFAGSLAKGGERLQLLDAAGNRADTVAYADDTPWPYEADGFGPSLELLDPRADNANPQAWTASDEGARAAWRTYTYTNVAAASAVGPDGQWQEFVLGLLQAGDVLLDDISVVADPAGAATELLQNGTFESDALGAPPAAWRIIGNHRHSVVEADPAAPANHVLHLRASGPTEHLHNHAETTLAGGATIQNGTTYRISFRARWLAGSPLLNTRLYFTRCARTTTLDTPEATGTPGTANSRAAANIGPTASDLQHTPAVPPAGQAVIVGIGLDDPDGVATATLWYARDGLPWTAVTMAAPTDGGNRYTAELPGQAAGDVVQFYVEAVDTRGATALYPPGGRASRALYRVDDGHAATNGLSNFRIVMTAADYAFMLQETNRMSNERLGATIITDERDAHYDAGVRLKASGYGRNDLDRAEFMVRFNHDSLYRGEHRDVAIDRSESGGVGQREMLAYVFMNRVGGAFSRYSDYGQCLAPQALQTSPCEIRPDRLGEPFVESSFDNGRDGDLYEYELIYYPVTTVDGNPESPKLRAQRVIGTKIRNLGNSKEQYRWSFLLKINRADDRFSRLMQASRVYDTTNTAFLAQIGDYLDVDEWLRAFAMAVADGHGDSFASGHLPHNAFFYVRPDDGRLLYLPHDMDHAWRVDEALVPNADLARLVAAPAYERLYYVHLHDILETAYNRTYMQRWAEQFHVLAPAQPFDAHLDFIGSRSGFLAAELAARAAPYQPMTLWTPTTVDANTTVVSGTASLDVYAIRLAGQSTPLDATWTAEDTAAGRVYHWSATIPLTPGTNNLRFVGEACNGTERYSIPRTILCTAGASALARDLRVSELMAAPRDGADYEFIELTNIGDTPLDIADVRLTDGIEFAFAGSDVTNLAPGAFVVVARDRDAFAARYDTNDIAIAGAYSGKLANEGEHLRLTGPLGITLLEFTYGKGRAWPAAAQGAGHALVLRDVTAPQENAVLDQPRRWRAGYAIDGSPGHADPAPAPAITINELAAHTDYGEGQPWQDSNDWIELFNAAATGIAFDAHWYLSDDADALTKWPLPAGSLAAGNWQTFYEVGGFHPSPESGFGLDKAGEAVFLSYLPGNGADRVVDAIIFDGQENGQTLGRYPDGADAWYALAPTPTAANARPSPGVVLDEIMYHPLPDDPAFEFVELLNASSNARSLTASEALPWDPAWSEAWRLAGGADFAFAPGTVLAAGERVLIVGFDPGDPETRQRFLEHYALTNGAVRIFGPFAGQLANGGERLALEKPEPPDEQGEDTVWVVVDEVIYDDRAPWPTEADGTGTSLQRAANPPGNGLDETAWSAALVATPGAAPARIALVAPHAGDRHVAPCTIPLRTRVDARFVAGTVSAVTLLEDTNTIATLFGAPYDAPYACDGSATSLTFRARLSDDEGLHLSAPVSVRVYTNRPTVTTAAIRVLNAALYGTLTLSAELELNGLPADMMTHQWRQTGGEGTVLFSDPTAPGGHALFSSPGDYTLELVSAFGGRALTNTVAVSVLATNGPNALPYVESFEHYDRGSRIDGVLGWRSLTAGTATITNGSGRADANLPILNQPHDRAVLVRGVVDNILTNTDSGPEIWVDTLVECIPRNRPWEQQPDPDYQFAFYFDHSGHLDLWHWQDASNRWTQLPDTVAATGQWARITIRGERIDGTNVFGVWFDGIPVTNPATRFVAANGSGKPLRAIRSVGGYRIDDLVADDYDVLHYRKIHAAAGKHGTVAPAGDTLVPIGTGTNIAIAADDYYHVAGISEDGAPPIAPADSPARIDWPLTNVLERRTLNATFAATLAAHGTPWWWLAAFGWTNNFDEHATADTDGDSHAAWREYLAGTVPTNRASALAITAVRRSTNGVDLTWHSVTTRTYTVERTPTPQGNATVLTTAVPGSASGTNTFTDPAPPDAPAFYRIRTSAPPTSAD